MNLNENLSLAVKLLPIEFLHTLEMVFGAALFGTLIGFPLGIYLWLTRRGGLQENAIIYRGIGVFVNLGRSIPFAILVVALIPFTRWVVGTSLGTAATIVPLTLAAAPFIARLVEAAFLEVSVDLVETAKVMGARPGQIIWKVLVPETLPALISGITLTLVNLTGYSAMAGLVGGGGLGKIAIQYGYQRFNAFLMFTTLLILLILVEMIQWTGNLISRSISFKRGVL